MRAGGWGEVRTPDPHAAPPTADPCVTEPAGGRGKEVLSAGCAQLCGPVTRRLPSPGPPDAWATGGGAPLCPCRGPCGLSHPHPALSVAPHAGCMAGLGNAAPGWSPSVCGVTERFRFAYQEPAGPDALPDSRFFFSCLSLLPACLQ